MVPLDEFFQGPNQTLLGVDEILTEIRIPVPAKVSRANYQKLGIRSSMEIAMVGVAASMDVSLVGTFA